MSTQSDIMAQLRKEVLALQGFKSPRVGLAEETGLGAITRAFPGGQFPASGLHEFHCTSTEERAASTGFVAGLLAASLRRAGALLWIGAGTPPYPPALKQYGLAPEQVLFLQLKKEKDAPWAIEEALRCPALTAVLAEYAPLSFTQSRRFQLAMESSGVGCYLLRPNPRAGATAAVARWQVRPVQTVAPDGLPGPGYPRWQVRLLQVRNGKGGSWDLEWRGGRFHTVAPLAIVHSDIQKRAV